LIRAALLAFALALLIASPAAAAPRLVPIDTFDRPLYVTSPPRDTRLFVVEKGGTIKIVGGGTFLDISSLVNGDQEERGLLSMAFAPDYATSGRFYVFYTADDPDGEIRVVEYRRSANPNQADPNSARPIFTTPHGAEFHNGGQLQFGPDGMLYISIGDAQDGANAQDLTANPLGKILRLNAVTGAAPADNPYGPVWAYGLRNPWRFSFDRLTADMVIGDVGDGTREEVDWARAPKAGRGLNFGWPCREGTIDHSGSCDGNTLTSPAFDYGRHGPCNAVVAGYVVRDKGLPSLYGRLIYGDLCTDALRSVALPNSGDREEDLDVTSLGSFGQDACGHVYAMSVTGPLYRIQDGAVSACSFAGPTVDRTPPGLRVKLSGVRTAIKRRRLLVAVRCSERCAAAIGTRLRKVKRLATRHRHLSANQRRVVRLELSKRTVSKLRKRLRRGGFVRVSVAVRATDASGNIATVTRRGRIKRRR
jgi:hypothetical protein